MQYIIIYKIRHTHNVFFWNRTQEAVNNDYLWGPGMNMEKGKIYIYVLNIHNKCSFKNIGQSF